MNNKIIVVVYVFLITGCASYKEGFDRLQDAGKRADIAADTSLKELLVVDGLLVHREDRRLTDKQFLIDVKAVNVESYKDLFVNKCHEIRPTDQSCNIHVDAFMNRASQRLLLNRLIYGDYSKCKTLPNDKKSECVETAVHSGLNRLLQLYGAH
jgi:hypothetical protein